jgi:hypothetical protein
MVQLLVVGTWTFPFSRDRLLDLAMTFLFGRLNRSGESPLGGEPSKHFLGPIFKRSLVGHQSIENSERESASDMRAIVGE